MSSTAVEDDQKWLLDCLLSTLDANQDIRSFAESSLRHASLQAGFAIALLKISGNRDLPHGLRQLSAVVLNQFIKKHWREDDDGFEQPVVTPQEKSIVRDLLLRGIDDPHKKVRTSISMAVTSVAQFDWPYDWPELLPFLLKLVNDLSNLDGIRGSLRCLGLITVDLDDKMAPTLSRILFPCLHTVISSIQYDNYMRGKAISIAYCCVSMLGIMSGVYRTDAMELMSQTFKPWFEQFSVILKTSVRRDDPNDWSTRLEVLKCLSLCFQNFPNLLSEAEYATLVGNLWYTFISSLEVYRPSSAEDPEYFCDLEYDSDGTEKSLESMVIQLFELLITVVGSRELLKIVEGNLTELVYYTIAFIQVAEQQVHDWNTDVNLYVSDEESATAYGVRGSCSLLLGDIVSFCGGSGVDAIILAAERRFAECQRDISSGSTSWWKMQEAILFVLSSLSEELLFGEVGSRAKSRLGQLLGHINTEFPLTVVHGYPFLYGRTLSTTALFSSVIGSGVLEEFLLASINSVRIDESPPVMVGACRAISELLPRVEKHVLRPHVTGLCSSLVDLQTKTTGEMLHLVLDTLCAVIKAGGDLVREIEPIISPIALDLWASHVSDPFITAEALDIIEAIKNSPSCMHPLVSRCLPHLSSVLNNPRSQPDGLVAGSLDFITMLLRKAPMDVVKSIHDACFNSVVGILLRSEDHGEMQNATECLSAFVSRGRHELLAWGGDPVLVMRPLMEVVSRLLDPGRDSSESLFAGNYIMNLLSSLPSQMAGHIKDLVAALVLRMQLCRIAGVKASLLLVFARLVHLSFPHVHRFVELLVSFRVEGYDNSLAFVMSEWVSHQGDVQGSYQIKVTTTALALLLSTGHPELEKISVKGNLVRDSGGIKTRSKAKISPDEWTEVALPIKMMALLADVMLEIQEQVTCVEESDDLEEDLVDDNGPPFSGDSPCGNPSRRQRIDAMAKVFHSGEEDSEESLLWAGDPVSEINLFNYLVDFFVKVYSGDRQAFFYLCNSLTQTQQNAIKAVLHLRDGL